MPAREASRTTGTAKSSAVAAPQRELTLLDTTAIIVGIIIGASIYKAPDMARSVPSLTALLAMWAIGGLIALIGALCYAELVGLFPKQGGDYLYLSRAYGKKMGFVFAWSELWVVRPGSIGAVAYVFADYANQLWPLDSSAALVIYAAGAIVLLSVVNIVGVRESKWTQNLLTIAKVFGLGIVIVVALAGPGGPKAAAPALSRNSDYTLALILILYAYGGWSEVAYVAAEVRNAQRNILRALLLGLGTVALIYVVANYAFASALGFEQFQRSNAIATDVLQIRGFERAGQLVAALICISTLGSIHGQIFTVARIYYALGVDQPMYAPLGRWSPRFGTPVAAIVLQTVATLIPVVAFGLNADGFYRLVIFATPVFWFFFLLVGIALFVLRQVEADATRAFRVPFYPWLPLAFCLSSLFMLYSSFTYAVQNRASEALWSVIILAVGYAFSFYEPRPTRRRKLAGRRKRRRRR